MKTPSMTSHRLGREDFLHLRGSAVRLAAQRGTLWVTQDGEPADIQIDAGASHVFDGHAPITVGTLGGDALLTATPLAPAAGPLLRVVSRLLAGLRGNRLAWLA